jgi:hypothetical protein
VSAVIRQGNVLLVVVVEDVVVSREWCRARNGIVTSAEVSIANC